jgi:hypothetical protein
MKKWANELNRSFSKEEVQMTQKHMLSYLLNIPGHKKIQIKSTLSTTSLMLERVSSRTQTTIKLGEDVRKKKPSYTLLVGM